MININFQPNGVPVPDNYISDIGAGFNSTRGFGWVTQASLGNLTPTPIDISPNARDRNANEDQRLDTFLHMQFSGTSNSAVTTPAAWEYELANGIYRVTVGVGDPLFTDSNHVINVEGIRAIDSFAPTSAERFKAGVVDVRVSDGKLTLDAIGGNNTKINFVKIEPFNPEIEIENLDEVPFKNRLVFSRIGSLTNPPPNGVHDIVTLRTKNTGSDPLNITGLKIAGPWEVINSGSFPTTIAPGEQQDIRVRFVATSGDLHTGTLTIESNDFDEPDTVVQLAGFWQSQSEGGQEPNLKEILQLFGYTTQITGPKQKLNNKGLVQAIGEEVLSPYWQRSDLSKPVEIRQLAAYHRYPETASVFWHNKGNTNANQIFVHEDQDGQTILPRINNTNNPAKGTFSPNSSFGFRVVGVEWSDPTLNRRYIDINNGSPGPAGHHVRFWPARDRQGQLIENTYIMGMDYSGINYDYNDNLYLISNVKPEPLQALYRIDVGSNSSYTDTKGNLWSADTGLFQPGDAIAGQSGASIVNTEDDLLYQTNRISSNSLTFNLPINGSRKVDVRFHFAELNTAIGLGGRLFDIAIEGTRISNNFDIFSASGGVNNATVVQAGGIQVSDGMLNITFTSELNPASIAAIEVLAPFS